MLSKHALAAFVALAMACPEAALAYGGDTGSPEESACTAALEHAFNSRTHDKYDSSKVKETKVTPVFYGVQSLSGAFGGNKFETVAYYVDTFVDGQITERSDAETVYCVLNPDNRVLGVETEMR